jgi:hypothetical protein
MSYYLDQKKIQQKIDQLNAESVAFDNLINPQPPSPSLEDLYKQRDVWEEVPGLYWYTEVTRFSAVGEVKVQPSGILIKLFANKVTSEIKTFPAKIFE